MSAENALIDSRGFEVQLLQFFTFYFEIEKYNFQSTADTSANLQHRIDEEAHDRKNLRKIRTISGVWQIEMFHLSSEYSRIISPAKKHGA